MSEAEKPFGTRRFEAIAALEDLLQQNSSDTGSWRRLASIRLQQRREGEALQALEYVVWDEDALQSEVALREHGVPWPASTSVEFRWYERVLALLTAGDAASVPSSLWVKWERERPLLRSRTCWILSRLLFQVTRDPQVPERERALLLSELDGQGLREQDLPPFLVEGLEAGGLAALRQREREGLRARVEKERFIV